MAINKNGTGYTFGFAIVMVVVVGASSRPQRCR